MADSHTEAPYKKYFIPTLNIVRSDFIDEIEQALTSKIIKLKTFIDIVRDEDFQLTDYEQDLLINLKKWIIRPNSKFRKEKFISIFSRRNFKPIIKASIEKWVKNGNDYFYISLVSRKKLLNKMPKKKFKKKMLAAIKKLTKQIKPKKARILVSIPLIVEDDNRNYKWNKSVIITWKKGFDINIDKIMKQITADIPGYGNRSIEIDGTFRLIFMNILAGGCKTHLLDKNDYKDFIIYSPKSSPKTNNCFFMAYKHLLNSEQKKEFPNIRSIRSEFNLSRNSKIDLFDAFQITKYYNSKFNVDINIYSDFDQATGNSLIIHNEHWYAVKNNEKPISSKIYPQKSEIIAWDIETFGDHHEVSVIGYEMMGNFTYSTNYDDMFETINKFYTKQQKEENVFVLMSYNGSNFDNYSLVQHVLEKNYQVSTLTMQASSIIMFEFEYKDIKFKVWDLAKLSCKSLDANLKDYGCNTLKGEYDYNKIDYLDQMSDSDALELIEYLKSDVLGLKELYHKKNEIYVNEFDLPEIHNFISVSHATYHKWVTECEYADQIFLPNNATQANYMRNAIYGGRTYKTRDEYLSKYVSKEELIEIYEQKLTNIPGLHKRIKKDHLRDIDAVSLYPSAMALYEYPIGKARFKKTFSIELSNKYLEKIKNGEIFGICYCNVICPDDHIEARLPFRSEGRLYWNNTNKIDAYYTTQDLADALNCGYEVDLHSMLYWKEIAPIFKNHIDFFFNIKENSDKSNPIYHEAKLFMNGLYGKCIQKPINARTIIVKKDQLDKIKAKLFEIEDYGQVPIFEVNDYVIFTHEEEKITNFNKPYHLGAMILGNSRKIMWELMEKIDAITNPEKAIYYTDTDSLNMHCSQVDKSFLYRGLGGFDDDLGKKARIFAAHYLAPKLYMLVHVDEDDNIRYHLKAKGIAKKDVNIELYLDLLNGKPIVITEQRNFNKMTHKVPSTKKDIKPFTVYKNEIKKKITPIQISKFYNRELNLWTA